jgi:hypothetical protein
MQICANTACLFWHDDLHGPAPSLRVGSSGRAIGRPSRCSIEGLTAMTVRDDAYLVELIGWTGTPFLRSPRPMTLVDIIADKHLMALLRRYRHKAWMADGQEIASLPGIDQPAG